MGRLHKLELENFKSYVGKQTIGPFDQFTSIIGPNGSGKSNLMDAISFVLGVNSSHLRSSHLVDLINRRSDAEIAETVGGSGKKRRAVKAVGAQKTTVSAFYLKSCTKQEEEEEIVFTRTVNNQGASEYLINGRVKTLAEYTAILESENVLVKARNFLVFQGDVEAIASKSPKDLTKLIEQISGSDEFKEEYDRLKDAHEKTMEASTFAFNKKRALTNEIKSVQDQKDDACRYEQLVLQRMDLISEQVMWKLFHIEAEAKEFSENSDALQVSLKKLEKAAVAGESQVKEHRKAQAKIQKDLLGIEKQIKKAQQEADSFAPEFLKLDEKHRFINAKIANLEGSRVKQQESLKRTQVDIAVVEKELEEIEAARVAFERNVEAKAAQTQLPPQLLEEYRSLKEKANEATGPERLGLEAAEHKLAPSLATRKHRQEKLKELEGRLKEIEGESEPSEERRRELLSELGVVQDERKSLQRQLARNQSELTKLQQAELEANENLRGCMEKLLQARIDQEESERELKSRAMIESLKRMFPGVQGRLVDLCQPTAKKYETAVAVGLGRHLDSIVVDSESTAVDCIRFLRQQRGGQATFIPLETIKSRPLAEKWRTVASGARPLLDVISFEGVNLRAFQYACGTALVCDSLDVAKNICYARGHRVKAIALDGTIIHKNGFLTGGGAGGATNAHGRCWDEKQVARLKSDRDALLVTLSEISVSLKRLEGGQKLRTQLAECEGRVEFLTTEERALERSLTASRQEGQHLRGEISRLQSELAEASGALRGAQEELDQLRTKIQMKSEKVFVEFCRKVGLPSIEAYERGRQEASQEATEKMAKFHMISSKLVQQLAFLRRQAEESLGRQEDLAEKLSTEHAALESLSREKALGDACVEERRRVLMDLKAREGELKLSGDEAARQLGEIKLRHQGQVQEISRVNKEVATMECEIERRLELRHGLLKRARLEEIDLPLARGSLTQVPLEAGAASAILAGIVVDYTVLGREARNRKDDAFEASYVGKIRELAEEIDGLAPRLRALEKLEGVEARLKATMEGFEQSRQDAKRSRDEFMAMKQKRHRAFTAAFRHISEAIDPIYKELTRSESCPTGGTAYLSLEDADEPYLEGIKYHAMPPLKRFLDMEQLSGGERTMAALALLFALHSYRPAPFFILDEVDAALDNANIHRLAAFIRCRAAASTQFVVISLKGNLYERAESLIGIYRDPEDVCSRVLSLKLSEYPE